MSRIDHILQRPDVQDEALSFATDALALGVIAGRYELTEIEAQIVRRALDRAEAYLSGYLCSERA